MGKGQAIAGLILSIVGLVFGILGMIIWFLALLALPMAIVGLVLSATGGKKLKANGQSAGAATAGLVIGILATVFSGITFFACGVCGLCIVCEGADAVNDLNDFANSLSGY